MILIGFGAALRSAELVALDVGDLAEAPDRGLVVTIRRSKTDRSGEGRRWRLPQAGRRRPIPLPHSEHGSMNQRSEPELPSAASTVTVGFWGGSRHAPSRCSSKSAWLLRAGIDSEKYSSHSLRAGLATSAALAGATELQITQQTGHKSTAMVKQYVRVADIWRDNVTKKIGI